MGRKNPPKNPGQKGREKHVPTKENRKLVESMAAAGVTQADIGIVLELSESTIAKYYRREINRASLLANTAVAGKLYEKCMAGDITAIIFWLKTRAKWRETKENPEPFFKSLQNEKR